MSRADFAFFRIPAGKGCFHMLSGCKSPRKGYIFQHRGFNSFDDEDKKLPSNARKQKTPDNEWISEFFWNPSRRRLVFDAANLPERASGKAYRIEDNGGMPFVCYVRDDAVSVFRQPKDGYVAEEDEPDFDESDEEDDQVAFDRARLVYTEEVITIDRPEKTWIGIDEETQQHGNSILVHASASKGKCLTATIKLDEDRQLLRVACTDLAGSPSVFVETSMDSLVGGLPKILEEYRHALYVKCVDENGKEVAHDRPLKDCSQLVLQDATQSYVYIGDEIYSFDCVETVTAYFSMMGNNSVPYPVARTDASVMFMLDGVKVARSEVAPHVVNDKWGEVYGTVFYHPKMNSTKTPFANRQKVSQRL